MSSDRPFDPNHKAFGCVIPHPEQVKRHRSAPQEQLFYVKLRLVPAGATIETYREFEDVVSVKFEEHWLRIFDKTGDWTFPRDRVIEVQTTRQP